MTGGAYWLAERVHGHLAVLGLAVLLHPIVSLKPSRRVRPGARLSALLALALIGVPYAVGWFIYPTYREIVKPGLLRDAHSLALAFEIKEHLALFVLALTVAGVGVLLAGADDERGRRAARALLAAAWLCGVVVGVLGIAVAAAG